MYCNNSDSVVQWRAVCKYLQYTYFWDCRLLPYNGPLHGCNDMMDNQDKMVKKSKVCTGIQSQLILDNWIYLSLSLWKIELGNLKKLHAKSAFEALSSSFAAQLLTFKCCEVAAVKLQFSCGRSDFLECQ